jgi:hypothetical protein
VIETKDLLFDETQALQYMNSVIEARHDAIKKADEIKASFTGGKVQTLKMYSLGNSYFTSDVAKCNTFEELESVKAKFQKLVEADEKIHEENKVILQQNKTLINNIVSLMLSIGLKKTITSRKSMSSKSVTKNCDWYDGILKEIVTVDTWPINQTLIDNILKVIDKKNVDLTKAENDKKKSDEAARQETAKLNLLVTLRSKYNIISDDKNPYSSLEEILEYLLDHDKYLMLAHYMCQNRGDWNDGYGYVENALGQFKVETDIDKDIVSELISICRCEDTPDGRCFRDCVHNYGTIYQMANKEMYADYNEISKLIDIFR